jgi:ankyrin repeat protein
MRAGIQRGAGLRKLFDHKMKTFSTLLAISTITLGVTSCNLMDPTPSQHPPTLALHKAVVAGDIERVNSLIAGNPMQLDRLSRGRTALEYAVSENNYAIAENLLKAGAHPDIASEVTGLAPIHTAANSGDLRMVKLLVQYGSDPQLQGKTPSETWTPIKAASMAERHEVVAYLKSIQHKN